MTNYQVVGTDVPRIDGEPKASGAARYAADLSVPNMLHGAILRGRHPHARILNVDVEKARRLSGVRAVVTARDVPPVRFGITIYDACLFEPEKVRYLGNEIAAVAAIDADTAQEALSLIEVEYEELPAVFDPVEAMRPDAPVIHEEAHTYESTFDVAGRRGNVACRTTFAHGDLEQGLREADEVIENTFRTQQNHQTYLEPHASLAEPDGSGGVTVWVNVQGVFLAQERISRVLGIPLAKIRVIGTAVGGGFGGKKPRTDPYAALLALKTGNPVRVLFTRDEEFTAGFPRHPATIRIRDGVKRDGRITAREAELIYDTGAYTDHGPTVAALGAAYAKGPYRIPNVRLESSTVYTNKPISGAFRGYGNPQSAFAVESQMDMVAGALGIDPLDFRRINALEDGDMLSNGQRFPRVLLKDTLEAARRRVDWQGPVPGRTGKRRGRGVACGQHHAGGLTSSATVKVMEDGSIQVASGVIEIGAGQTTMAAIVAAEEISVGVEDVRLVSGDTDATPFEFYSAASRITYNVGNVVRMASADAKRQLIERASDILEVPVEDLIAQNQRVFMPGSPERGLTYGQIVKDGHLKKGGPILGRGVFDPHGPPTVPEFMEGNPRKPMMVMTFCTQIAEVEVDVETGEVEILRLVCVHDVGQVINLGAIQGQIEGGVTQGVGYALIEEVVYEGGVVSNPTLVDYKIPNILDTPPIEYEFIEEPDPTGPFGAKGVGEAVLVPTAAAIANAVEDAVGARVTDLPITPERVLAALNSRAD